MIRSSTRCMWALGNLFGNIATEAAYTHGDEWLDQMLEYVKDNCRFVQIILKTFLPKIKAIPLEATYLLWLDFRDAGFGSDEELKDFMIHKAGLALAKEQASAPAVKALCA
jgi:cysteine-S-conjugate beta-lyase